MANDNHTHGADPAQAREPTDYERPCIEYSASFDTLALACSFTEGEFECDISPPTSTIS